jgi:hypothetical protein
MCILELVDYNEAMLGGEAAKTKTTRRRKAPKKKDEAIAEAKVPKSVKEKAIKIEKSVAKVEETSGESVPEE